MVKPDLAYWADLHLHRSSWLRLLDAWSVAKKDIISMKKIAFKTLGCRLNQYETDALAAQFRENGYEVSENEQGADVVIVNTCTVTNQSNQKSRYVISHAGRINPDARLVITGCMVESHKAQLQEKFPEASIIDNQGKSGIFHSVDSLLKIDDIIS